MTSYIGAPGGLVAVGCASEVNVSRAPRIVFSTSVEGVVRGQQLPRPQARAWEVSHAVSSPHEADTVEAFALGLYGRGPFTFVSCDAARLNVLTPSQSAFENVTSEFTAGGPVVIDGKPFPVSLSVAIPSSWRGLVDVPVVPGVPVTASVWVQSATSAPIITTAFYIGAAQQGTESVTGAATGGWQRLSYTGTPPAGATLLRLGVRSSVTAVAGPQVTYSSGPVDYAMGRASDAVVVESAQQSPIYLGGPAYVSRSYVVREVGSAGWNL